MRLWSCRLLCRWWAQEADCNAIVCAHFILRVCVTVCASHDYLIGNHAAICRGFGFWAPCHTNVGSTDAYAWLSNMHSKSECIFWTIYRKVQCVYFVRNGKNLNLWNIKIRLNGKPTTEWKMITWQQWKNSGRFDYFHLSKRWMR